MVEFQVFEVNPFAENTYLVWDETGECIIFDPGCYFLEEEIALANFIKTKKLRPVRLINTHCHLDHVFGNAFVSETWQLPLEIHRGELPVLQRLPDTCRMYGIPLQKNSPAPEHFIEDGDLISFGNSQLRAMLTPGHSPASLSFFCEAEKFVIAGDVLFFESIGRTDLPGGNLETLLQSIRTRLFALPEETLVLPGHGNSTTIQHEKWYNPFLNG